MFGIYRTLLALFVVASHLMSITIIGQYAVHGFFILSGYLMTLIMQRTYGYTPSGVAAFAANRFLRLYPSYWVLCVPMILFITWAGRDAASSFNPSMGLPEGPLSWLQNATMLFADAMPMLVVPRIAPPTWALTVELLFYSLIAFGLSKTPARSIIWLGLSLLYMAATHLLDLPQNYRYAVITGGSLPFSMGACLYHFHSRFESLLGWLRSRNGFITLLFFFGLNCLAGCLVLLLKGPPTLAHVFFYLNLIANFLVVFALSGKELSFPVSRRLDLAIGDFSYPIYLIHYPVGLACSMLVFGEPRRGFHLDGMVVTLCAIPVCLILSYMAIRFVDRPVQTLRSTLKTRRISARLHTPEPPRP